MAFLVVCPTQSILENADSVLNLIKQHFPNHRQEGRDSKVSSRCHSTCLLALTQTQRLSPRLSGPSNSCASTLCYSLAWL